MLLFRIKSQPGVAYKEVCKIVLQSSKHEQIAFPQGFIFVFIQYFIGTINEHKKNLLKMPTISNLLVPNATSLYPVKHFQGVYKCKTRKKWVKFQHMFENSLKLSPPSTLPKIGWIHYSCLKILKSFSPCFFAMTGYLHSSQNVYWLAIWTWQLAVMEHLGGLELCKLWKCWTTDLPKCWLHKYYVNWNNVIQLPTIMISNMLMRKVEDLNDSPKLHMICIKNKKAHIKSMNVGVSNIFDVCWRFSERFHTKLIR